MDNTKMFYAAWIPIAIQVFGLYFAKILKNKYTMIIGLVLIAAASASAIKCTYDRISNKSTIIEPVDLEFGEWCIENTPLHAIFLTSTWHAHPVCTVAGRQTYSGYGGWILSHGLDFFLKNEHMTWMLDDPYDQHLFHEDRITYVINRNNEFKKWVNITNQRMWVKIYDRNGYQCWKIRSSMF